VTVPSDCTGSVIGKGGATIKRIIAQNNVKVQGPKRGEKQTFKITGTDQATVNAAAAAIEEIRDSWLKRNAKHQAYQLNKEKQERKRNADWSRHIRETSGCEGDDWGTVGTAKTWQNKNRSRSDEAKDKTRIVTRNRFELPESDDEDTVAGPIPCKPEAPTGSWAPDARALNWGEDTNDNVCSNDATEDSWGDAGVADIKWVPAAPVTKHTAKKTPKTTVSECPNSPDCTTSGGGFECAEMDDAGW
jgi:hypothetical protein